PAHRSWAGARRPRRANRRRARGLGRRPAGACRRGAVVPVPRGPLQPVTIRSVRRGAVGSPPLLSPIPDPPPVIWVRGDAPLDVLARPAVAVVGARACSGYGRSVARLLAGDAAAAGGGGGGRAGARSARGG